LTANRDRPVQLVLHFSFTTPTESLSRDEISSISEFKYSAVSLFTNFSVALKEGKKFRRVLLNDSKRLEKEP